MDTSWSHISESPLFAEHLLLGALFEDEEPLLAAPLQYGHPESEHEAFGSGCALADLTGMTALLVNGDGADAFMAMVCAHTTLGVGECAFSAIVTGDGSIASVPLVARTGDTEYLMWDPTERGLMLLPWLQFLAGIEQDSYRPFESVRVSDVSDSLAPLLLWGPQSPAVLADYLPAGEGLPMTGRVKNAHLDRIECLIASIPHDDEACFLVLVPPATARVLWRSFLSFAVMEPVGTRALVRRARSAMPWMGRVLDGERMEVALQQLIDWEIARVEGGFVGHRALLS